MPTGWSTGEANIDKRTLSGLGWVLEEWAWTPGPASAEGSPIIQSAAIMPDSPARVGTRRTSCRALVERSQSPDSTHPRDGGPEKIVGGDGHYRLMPGFQTFLNGRAANRELVEEYLERTEEWTGVEFKRADKASDFGLRKAVSALANAQGGEVWVGVDESLRRATGTDMDPDSISKVLTQEEVRGPLPVVTDLRRTISVSPISVDVGNNRRAYCLEVRPPGVPCLVKEDAGTWAMFKREGRESKLLDAVGVLRESRRIDRASMLRQVYTEFRDAVRTHLINPRSQQPPDPDPMPRFRELRRDGSWESLATASDRSLLSDFQLGIVLGFPSFFEAAQRRADPRNLEIFPRELYQSRELMRDALKDLEQYLRREGVDLPP